MNRHERRAAAARGEGVFEKAPAWLERHRAILASLTEPLAEAFGKFAEAHAATGVALVVAVGGDPLAQSLVAGAGETLEAGAVAIVPMTSDQALDVLGPAVAPEVEAALRALTDDGPPIALVIQGGRSSSWALEGEVA